MFLHTLTHDCLNIGMAVTALQATEKHHGLKFVFEKLPRGSMLLEVSQADLSILLNHSHQH